MKKRRKRPLAFLVDLLRAVPTELLMLPATAATSVIIAVGVFVSIVCAIVGFLAGLLWGEPFLGALLGGLMPSVIICLAATLASFEKAPPKPRWSQVSIRLRPPGRIYKSTRKWAEFGQ